MNKLFHIGPNIGVAEIMDCGAALRDLPSLVPTNLVSRTELERLATRVDGLSTSILGFEFRLGESVPSTDLLLGIIPESMAEQTHLCKGQNAPEGSYEAAFINHIARVRNGNFPEAALITMTILEYDVAAAHGIPYPPPAVFHGILTRSHQETGIRDAHAAGRLAAAIAASIKRPEDVQEIDAVYETIAALPLAWRLTWIGAMPGREPRMIRALFQGLEAGTLTNDLYRMGWPGSTETVTKVLEMIDGCFEHLTVQLEVSAQGILPRLGLEVYVLKPRPSSSFANWAAAPNSALWRPLLSRLEETGLCLSSKARALLAFPGREYILEDGIFEIHKGINHVKISIEGNQACTAKAYVGTLCRPIGV